MQRTYNTVAQCKGDLDCIYCKIALQVESNQSLNPAVSYKKLSPKECKDKMEMNSENTEQFL